MKVDTPKFLTPRSSIIPEPLYSFRGCDLPYFTELRFLGWTRISEVHLEVLMDVRLAWDNSQEYGQVVDVKD